MTTEIEVFKSLRKRFVHTVLDRPLPPETAEERASLAELRRAFASLPVADSSNKPPSEELWLSYMNRLRELVLSEDPRGFLRWDVIERTMFVGSSRYIEKELNHLKQLPDWKTRWREAIRESSMGHPEPYSLHPASSGNLIHHAYHVARFEEQTGARVSDMVQVLEFGGGYGSMCRLFHKLGFRGRYLIFDLPSFSALQAYYLDMLGLPVLSSEQAAGARPGIVCVTDIEQLRAMIGDSATTASRMFMATWSISEAPVHIRDSVLPLTTGFDSFLVAFQDRFEEVDNVAFFGEWKLGYPDVAWKTWEIEHLPGNRYLVGAAASG